MKSRTGIILITVLLVALSVYRLSFTFVARGVQQDAVEYATNSKGIIDNDRKQFYLDSMWTKTVYTLPGYEFTYKDVKEKELSLGLDLQGGMHVTLEVSPIEIIRALSNNNRNPKFQEALLLAKKRQQDSQAEFVDLFASAYQELEPSGELKKIFTNTTTRGKIDFNSSNDDVINVIREEVKDAFDRSFNIIRTRIDKFGVANPNIQKLPGSSRILVELPGVDNPERVRKLLSGVAKLEFWEVWNTQDLLPYYQEFVGYVSRDIEKEKLAQGAQDQNNDVDLVAQDTTDQGEESNPLLGEEEEEVEDDSTQTNPLLAEGDSLSEDSSQTEVGDTLAQNQVDSTQINTAAQLMQPSFEGFTVKTADTARVNNYLSRSEVKRLFPNNVKFFWDVKANEAAGVITLYAIKTGRGGKAPLSGEVVIDARQDFDGNNPSVSMQMNATGARIWRRLTAENVGNRVAIVLDNFVYSAPNVNGEIPSGSSVIQGNFTITEAKDLANVLKAGKLPAPIRIVEEATVGPSLGKESIEQGLNSMLLGLGLVVVFMMLYYRNSGAIADIALLLNIFLVIGVLAQFGAVLTLPGIAGIVLTIGMSVDANVLVFERIREELRDNRSYKKAIADGYSKAMSSIVDANATTFLTGVILYLNGTGGVKGFAVTLMIGIACSLFCAIFITRILIDYFTRKQGSRAVRFDSIIFGKVFDKIKIDFVKLRKTAYIFSASIIILGFVIMFYPGLTLGVDFKGGRSYVVEFDTPVAVNAARTQVSGQFEGSVEVKTFGDNNKLKITTSYLIDDESPDADQKVESALMQGLDSFKDKNPEVISFSKVGATIADDIAQTAYIAVVLSLLVIFAYIFIRIGQFRYWQYGVGALVALIHDVIVVIAMVGVAKIFGFVYEVDQVFIAAMLTVVGYSINDTVVVFDRIKEFVGTDKAMQSANFPEKLNSAINSTLSRTIMTSSTTLLVVLTLFLLGGEVLRGFSYSLLIGVLIGTYSSVFIASPIFLDISLLQLKRKKAAKPAK